MKFFKLIPLSNFHAQSWAYLDDVPNIPEPFHQLYCLYSKHHILQPRSVAPNTSSQAQEIPAEEYEKSAPLTFLQEYLCSMTVDIQRAYEYDLCSQHLSISERPLYHKSALKYLCNEPSNPLAKHDNDTSLPIQYDNSNYSQNVSSSYTLTFRKFKKFIETKVTAMKLQGFNL